MEGDRVMLMNGLGQNDVHCACANHVMLMKGLEGNDIHCACADQGISRTLEPHEISGDEKTTHRLGMQPIRSSTGLERTKHLTHPQHLQSVWKCMPVAHRWRQKNQKFGISLGYIVRSQPGIHEALLKTKVCGGVVQ